MSRDMSEQLPLDLPWRPALERADFMVAPCNAAAVALVDAWPAWPGPTVALWGQPGSGKSHLARVFAGKARARMLDAASVAGTDCLSLFDGGKAAVLEDADAAGLSETTLFHLLNAVRAMGGSLLLTASRAPAHWPVALPDLRSRLAALPGAELSNPDDDLISVLLLKLFADRGLDVANGVVTYALARMERSFDAARELVIRADRLALAEKRAVTVPLIKRVMAEMDGSDGSGGGGAGDDGMGDDGMGQEETPTAPPDPSAG